METIQLALDHAEGRRQMRPAQVRNLRENGPWIQTHSGRCYPLLVPEAEDVTLGDIAYALAGQSRYTGHARRSHLGHSYSIAQHSVLVSYVVPEEHALAGLMHDAAEAYVGDVASPLKRLLPAYQLIERIAHAAVAARFGLPLELSPEVKHADLVLLATEKRDLMKREPKPWLPLPKPLPSTIEIWPAQVAERRFLDRFAELRVREAVGREQRDTEQAAHA